MDQILHQINAEDNPNYRFIVRNAKAFLNYARRRIDAYSLDFFYDLTHQLCVDSLGLNVYFEPKYTTVKWVDIVGHV